MAHELEMIGDQASMAYAGELPWHGLGTAVPADLTPEQMLKAANLDWTVEKVPAFANIAGENIAVGKSALVRSSDNKILDVVSDDWNPVQNHAAFEFFSEYVNAGDMEMHTAGSLHGGRNIWALAKVKDSFFDLFGGDKVEGFLLFSNPHQYGKSIDVRFTPIRVVCNNTLSLSLSKQSERMAKMNHRREFNADAVKETLGIATDKLAKYEEMARFLGSKQYTNESIVEYFNRVFPMTTGAKLLTNEPASRAARQAIEILHTQPGAEYAEGSWWQAFNAVTYLTDHELGRSADTRMSSAWFGANQSRKVTALNLAVEMAEAA